VTQPRWWSSPVEDDIGSKLTIEPLALAPIQPKRSVLEILNKEL